MDRRGPGEGAGATPDDFAAQQATTWKDGLAGWGFGSEQITALRSATDFTIYTPGSQSGVPVNIVGSLQVPATADAEVVGDEIDGFVAGLLGLVGIEADPLSSREHILLANLIQTSWSQGVALDLPTLVGQIQQPPIRKLGVFELEQFFPAGDRTTLAMRLNGLLASPSFAAWGMGQPLDIAVDAVHGPTASRRCAIVTTAHLSDEERQFVTALILSKLVTWMRRQSGTTDLRALLYMDEVAGYLPPTANPPTKKPIMMLMKQARAFGRRRRAVDAEPGRHRLQGDLQRRHVDGRAAADRARQAAPARRHVGGRRDGRRRRRRRHDQRAGQARVRPAARRQGPARGVHDALGDELPARPDDARPDRAGDAWQPAARPRTGGRADVGAAVGRPAAGARRGDGRSPARSGGR